MRIRNISIGTHNSINGIDMTLLNKSFLLASYLFFICLSASVDNVCKWYKDMGGQLIENVLNVKLKKESEK